MYSFQFICFTMALVDIIRQGKSFQVAKNCGQLLSGNLRKKVKPSM